MFLSVEVIIEGSFNGPARDVTKANIKRHLIATCYNVCSMIRIKIYRICVYQYLKNVPCLNLLHRLPWRFNTASILIVIVCCC